MNIKQIRQLATGDTIKYDNQIKTIKDIRHDANGLVHIQTIKDEIIICGPRHISRV